MSRAPDSYGEAQALVRSGFGSLASARYILLAIEDAGAARRWLARFVPTTVADITDTRASQVRQIAFTHAGLAALGLAREDLESFPAEFQLGMGSETIARRLGDFAANAPENWQWGAPGAEGHILIVLLAQPEAIEELEAGICASLADGGLSRRARHASDTFSAFEPFGFRDGISQPEIAWNTELTGPRHAYDNRLALGELLLGHRDEYGLLPDSPVLRRSGATTDLGRNGTYLVFRRLAQDVGGFWQWLHATTGNRDAAVRLAERIVGRQRDGSPLAGLSRAPNDFTFAQDPEGRLCPLGAHVRRANPRIGDLPAGKRGLLGAIIDMLGFTGTAENDAIAASRFHRLVRRGRPFGGDPSTLPEPFAPRSESGPMGLNFICLNTNIARQFEFVQGAWLNSGRFAGLGGQGDPLTGTRTPFPGMCPVDRFAFRDPEDRLTLLEDIPPFVRVEAGGYFFLPGASALRALAHLD